MKKKNNLITHLGAAAFIAILEVVVFLTLGCASAPKDTPTGQAGGTNVVIAESRAGNALETAAYLATGWHLSDNPEDRDWVELIPEKLTAVTTAASFLEIAAQLAGKDEKKRLMIGGAMLFFDQELSRLPVVQQPAFIKETAARFQKGINRALGEGR